MLVLVIGRGRGRCHTDKNGNLPPMANFSWDWIYADYVRDYGLERSEGLLLRHLMQTWKVLAQTVPDSAKTPEVVEMEDYFRELIRGIDSSLLDEWEKMRDPDYERRDPSRLHARAVGRGRAGRDGGAV